MESGKLIEREDYGCYRYADLQKNQIRKIRNLPSSQFHAHIFRFGKKFQRLESAFSSNARTFYTTERSSQIAEKPAVDPHNSALQFSRHTMRAREVLRPHRCSKSVLRAVCHHEYFLFGVEWRNRYHWTKNLLLICSA